MLWPSWALGTNYYCKPSGSDAATGLSYANAFQTVSKLSDSCNAAGDTGFIAPGEYDAASGRSASWSDYGKGITFPVRFDGSAGNPIVFRSMHDSTRPTICGNRGTWNRYAIAIHSLDWVVFDSLIVKQAFRGIQMDACNHVVIQNTVVCSTFINGSGLTPDDNNAGVMMNYLEFGDSCTVRACTLFTNYGWKSGAINRQLNHEGIQNYRTSTYSRMTNNYIYDEEAGIRLKSGLTTGIEIDSNWITDCSNGIYGYGFDHANVHHNILWDVGQGIKPLIRGNANDSPIVALKIWNNTVYHSTSGGIIGFGDSEDSPDQGQYRSCSLFNNIVVNDNGSSRELATLVPVRNTGTYSVIDSQLFFDYNLALDPGDSTTYRWNVSGTNLNYTLSQFIANTRFGDNSIKQYPGFVDTTVAGGYNLNIDTASLAADGGRGGDYPTYMGALDPLVNNPPDIDPTDPPDLDTIAPSQINLQMGIYDENGSEVTVTIIGEKTDATPEDTLADSVLIADTSWSWTWTGLEEDADYYWFAIGCDQGGACDTTPIRKFTRDSIQPPDTNLFYVSKAGDDANPGTEAAPFLTIRRAIDSARAGDTVFIGPGEYEEAYGDVYPVHDFAWDAGPMYMRYGGDTISGRLVFRSYHGEERPVIIGHRGYADRYVAALYPGLGYVTLDSLIFKWGVRGVYMTGTDNLVQNCEICSCYIGRGPYTVSTDVYIDNCAGIFFNYTNYGSGVARNNDIYAIAARTNEPGTPVTPGDITETINNNGILIYFTTGGCRFTGNRISNTFSGIRSKTGFSSNVRADSNWIHDVGVGITGYGWDTGLVEFNVIYNTQGEGILMVLRGAVPGFEATSDNTAFIFNLVIRNNTIYNNGSGGILLHWDPWPVASHPEYSSNSEYINCEVYNNIVVAANGSAREAGILEKENTGACSTSTPGVCGLYWDYNSWYDPTDSVAIRWYDPTVENWTVTEFRNNTTHGNNDYSTDPQLVDAPNGDFRLLLGSDAEDTGRGGGTATYRGAIEPESTIPPLVTSIRGLDASGTQLGVSP